VPRQKSDHVDSAVALAARLRQARERAGISQRALARGICTPAYVSRLEKGERIPSLQLLRRLADRLGTDADQLASGQAAAAADPLLDAELALRLGARDDAQRAFERFSDHEDVRLRARALAGLGELALARGDHRFAIDTFERIQPGQLDGPHAAAAADSLGRAYAMVGELESAIAIFETERERARSAGDAIEVLRFSVLLSNALIDGGRFGHAAEILGEALASVSGQQDPMTKARLWWSQSRLHEAQQDFDTAARYARRALETIELTEHSTYAAHAHQLLAHIEIDRGHAGEALDLLDRGYPLIEQSGNRYHQGLFLLERARALAKLGDREQAASIAMEASTFFGEASPSDMGRAYALVAKVFADLGDHAKAIELFELAEDTLPETNRYRSDVIAQLADLLEQAGRQDEALQLLKRAVRLKTETPATT
jgi:tetratricopeptide (TPR) repeat protein